MTITVHKNTKLLSVQTSSLGCVDPHVIRMHTCSGFAEKDFGSFAKISFSEFDTLQLAHHHR